MYMDGNEVTVATMAFTLAVCVCVCACVYICMFLLASLAQHFTNE